MKHTKWIIRLTVVLACLPSLVQAQGVDPDVPIDGGLGFLLAAGVGYGVKKIRDSRKQKKAEENI